MSPAQRATERPAGAIGREAPRGEAEITTGSAWRGDRRALAVLLFDGYAKKSAALRVDREAALGILAEALDPDRCFVAVKDGRTVGIVGLVVGDTRALAFPFALLRRHFGALRAAAYSVPLLVRSWDRPSADEIEFETLAVEPSARHQGIGTSLVRRVESHARARGCRSVGLEVVDSNEAAIRLYSRLGYTIVKTRRYAFVTRQAGFGACHRMRKNL